MAGKGEGMTTDQRSVAEREHAMGVHERLGWGPKHCLGCYPDGPGEVAAPVLTVVSMEATAPVESDDSVAGMRRLRGGALAAGRRLFDAARMGPPLPEPDPNVAQDGGPHCDTCKDNRRVIRDLPVTDPEFGKSIPCPAAHCRAFQIQKVVDRMLGRLPLMFRDWTLKTFPRTCQGHLDVLDQGEAWLGAPGDPWLVLIGGPGVCKTGLMCGLLRAAAECGIDGSYAMVPDVLDRIKETFSPTDTTGISEMQMLRALAEVSLLGLDELGKNQSTPWAIREIFKIVTHRHDGLKRTIITGQSLAEISAGLGEIGPPTISRILEMTHGGEWIIDMSDLPDMRQATPKVVHIGPDGRDKRKPGRNL